MTPGQTLSRRLETTPPTLVTLQGVLLVLLLGLVDLATGEEVSFSVFYAAPVSIVAWYAGWRWSVGIGVLAAAIWLNADLLAGATYSAPWIPYWNAGVRLGFFLIIAHLLVRLRTALEAQRALAEADPLTGLANGRRFMEAVRFEVARSARYRRPVSLAYIDLDGFKAVNDRFGHQVGDDVLTLVGRTLKAQVRATDLPARLGGDEFAILFPETGHAAVRDATEKVRAALQETVEQEGWPVGFSVGVITSGGSITEADELVRRADELMYGVKHAGKGAVHFETTAD